MKNKKKNNPSNSQDKKMTIYDYEEKYVKRQNNRGAAALIKLIAVVIGMFLFYCLFSVFWKVYEVNLYAGIAAGVLCIIAYIFLFIVPLRGHCRGRFMYNRVHISVYRAAGKNIAHGIFSDQRQLKTRA